MKQRGSPELELSDCRRKKQFETANRPEIVFHDVVAYDDLKLIQGIGSQIEHLLNVASLTTFDQLHCESARVIEILQREGDQF